MARISSPTGIASALLALLLLGGCFTNEENLGDKPPPVDTTKTVIGPKKNNGWDDFPNKYLPTLKELAGKMTKLPTPYGFRYNSQNGVPSKRSADTTCPAGDHEIFGLNLPEKGLYMVDTIRYYNAAGEAGCRWHTLNTVRVTHNRYVLDLNSGESWEVVIDSISDQVVLPRHSLSGTGRIRLNSKLDFTVDSYRVDYLTPYAEPGAIVRSGHLKLGWKEYRFEMEISKTMPFRVDDFFPARGESTTEKMMSGPILHPGDAGKTDTLGYIDLHSDHSVVIRDWTGKAINP